MKPSETLVTSNVPEGLTGDVNRFGPYGNLMKKLKYLQIFDLAKRIC